MDRTTRLAHGAPARQQVPDHDRTSACQPVAGVDPQPTDPHALRLRWSAAGVYLFGASAGVFPLVEAAAFTQYMDAVRRDAGDPADPVEQMLLEQVALAHHAVGQLFMKASAAETVGAAGVYLAAATRLTAEVRKTAVALKEYRSPAARVPAVPNGVGVSEPGSRAAAGHVSPGPRLLDRPPDTELGGDAPEGDDDRAHRVA
jgi:hypothetical protein